MNRLALFALVALLGVASAARIPVKDFAKKENKAGHKWAVLIAGSASWGNYRHQADVYHAYQVLKRGGLVDKRIIVLHTDDIANSGNNPHKGQVINIPGGADVYAGVPKDYTGSDVNAKVFLGVLAGDESAVADTKGSKKLLKPTANDEVFIYFADHGGPGILGMPTPPYLHAQDLVDTLKALAAKQTFKHITFYVEACESGSIFDGLLPNNLNIYVTTAANPSESSWGYYCPGQKVPAPAEYSTCLGDLYSIAFLEDSDVSDLRKETLLEQYNKVKMRTSQNGTYSQGSHVMQYGQLDFDSEEVGEYMGHGNKGGNTPLNVAEHFEKDTPVSQRDAELMPLWHAFMHADSAENKLAASDALQAELKARSDLDRDVAAATKAALATSNALLSTSPEEHLASVRPAGQPLVDDWTCHKEMFNAWADACGYISQYGMKHGRAFANLCNAGVAPSALKAAAQAQCKVELVAKKISVA